jgi:hypothetical protein
MKLGEKPIFSIFDYNFEIIKYKGQMLLNFLRLQFINAANQLEHFSIVSFPARCNLSSEYFSDAAFLLLDRLPALPMSNT